MTRRTSLTTQALLLHLGVLVVVLASGVVLVGLLLRSELEGQYEQRAVAIARSVAADPTYALDLATGTPSPGGDVQQRAEDVRLRTGALFVVVADRDGLRWSHPNTALIGQLVSTDPSGALAGREVVALERGTLGPSARGKVPLRDAAGAVVGEVSVGIEAGEVHRRLVQLLRGTAGFALLALVLGTGGVLLLVRRLKRQTLGLEPAELTDLVLEHEAVLHGVQDGVLAVDGRGRVALANDTARSLLGEGVVAGAALADVVPPRLGELVRRREEVEDAVVLAGERVLVVTARPVARAGRDLGLVLTLRDRTDLDDLGRELDTVRALFDALRAQAHEHSNRLHALGGLLALGSVDEARDYLTELRVDPLAGEDGPVQDPYLRGLLAAKASAAAERGVRVRLSEDSRVPGSVQSPLEVVTVLGNLVDNAVRAAAEGPRRPAWVEVALAADGDTLYLAVTDSGAGLNEQARTRAFDDGWTTTSDDGRPHGLGLPLARQTARRHGGDLRVVAVRGPDHGAVLAAELPGVLERRPAQVAP